MSIGTTTDDSSRCVHLAMERDHWKALAEARKDMIDALVAAQQAARRRPATRKIGSVRFRRETSK